MEKAWKFFPCPQTLLNLDIVLACGQCFRWSKNESEEWVGVIGKRIWILKQNSDQLFYKSIARNNEETNANIEKPRKSPKIPKSHRQPADTTMDIPFATGDSLMNDEEAILKDYFQLSVDLDSLYKKWSTNDQFFNKLSQNFGGLRMLRQDPVENLFSFICSQNNHITRISSMVEKLCANYGECIQTNEDKSYFSFPNLKALSDDNVEGKLRELGFGYRAKFINQCAKQILKDGGDQWLNDLRKVPYKEAHSGKELFIITVISILK